MLARLQEATRSAVKAASGDHPPKNLELEELQALQSSRAEACLQGSRPGALLPLLSASGVNK